MIVDVQTWLKVFLTVSRIVNIRAFNHFSTFKMQL